MSTTDTKAGENSLCIPQQKNVGQSSPIAVSGNCSYCEAMYKNLQYLENYLRSNSAKNSCNSCATCLSYLIYMKQQGFPPPKFDTTNAIVCGAVQSNNLSPSTTAVGYAVQETVTYNTVGKKKAKVHKKASAKGSLESSRLKLASKSIPSVLSPKKLSKSQPALAQRLGVGEKKLIKLVSSKTKKSASSSADSSQTKKSTSNLSKPSSITKRKSTKLSSTKSALSKVSGLTGVSKGKVKTRGSKKVAKTT